MFPGIGALFSVTFKELCVLTLVLAPELWTNVGAAAPRLPTPFVADITRPFASTTMFELVYVPGVTPLLLNAVIVLPAVVTSPVRSPEDTVLEAEKTAMEPLVGLPTGFTA
jgi:hypothetical protein